MIKKVTTGFILMLAGLLPHAASAAMIEATWNVAITSQRDFVTGDTGPITVPTEIQVRTAFSTANPRVADFGGQVLTAYDYGQDVQFRSSLESYTEANPLPYPTTILDSVHADTFDGSAVDNVRLYIGNTDYVEHGSDYWEHYSVIQVWLTDTEAKHGEFTEADLWEFLTDLLNGDGVFFTHYVEGSFVGTLRDDQSYEYHRGSYWTGAPKLVGLRRIDVPEPPALALIGAGLLITVLVQRKRLKR